MNRRCIAALAALVASSVSFSAAAQSVGNKGDFSIAAERVFGFAVGSAENEDGTTGIETETDYVKFSLLWNGQNPPLGASPVFAVPRVGFDYFIIDGLSLGGAAGFSLVSTDLGPADIDTTSFLLHPRVGYLAMFNDTIGIWPRGGLTMMFVSSETDPGNAESDANLFALTAEAPLAIAVENVMFQVGPTIDWGFAGEQDDGADEDDLSVFEFGIYAGIGGVF